MSAAKTTQWLVQIDWDFPDLALVNGTMETWTAGATEPPDGWVETSAGIASRNATAPHGGTYSLEVQKLTGVGVSVYQSLVTAALPISAARGRVVRCEGWVRSTDASRAALAIASDVGQAYSELHSGSGDWERLIVDYTVPTTATTLLVLCSLPFGLATAQFDDLVVTWASGYYAMTDLDLTSGFYAGALLDEPEVSREANEVRWGVIETQEVRLSLANGDGALTQPYLQDDIRGAKLTLQRFERGVIDAASTEWQGLITKATLGRGVLSLEARDVDPATLEQQIPIGGVVEPWQYPFADPAAFGEIIPWVFGFVAGLPLLYLRDDISVSVFDYAVCRHNALTLGAVWRVGTDGQRYAVAPAECSVIEPLVNGDFERWDAGDSAAPTGWTLTGAGGSAARDQTAGYVWEGLSAVTITRAGTNVILLQDVVSTDYPVGFWQGRSVTFRARVRTATASVSRLRIDDGVGTTDSTLHTGGDTFEWLTVTRTIDAAATKVECQLRRVTTDGSTTMDAAELLVPAESWEEALRVDIFPKFVSPNVSGQDTAGMGKIRALRFFQRQDDSNGTLYSLIADVHGQASLANPARAIQELLSHTTSGLGEAVDSTTFDAAATALAFDYRSVVRLADPALYFGFDDDFDTASVAHDTSGHERHGTYTGSPQHLGPAASDDTGDFGVGFVAGQYVTVPYATWMDSTDISVELWYSPADRTSTVPIIDKANAGALQYSLYQVATEIRWSIQTGSGASTQAFTIDVGDVATYMHIVGVASVAGGQILYKNGGPADTSPTGTLAAGGPGDLTIGRIYLGTTVGTPQGGYDKVAIYTRALTATEIDAHYDARLLSQNPVNAWNTAVVALSPTHSWRLVQTSGTTANDSGSGAVDGTYVGGLAIGTAPGPQVTTERGMLPCPRFVADSTQYVSVTGQSFGGTAMTIMVWWRPAALNYMAILDKVIAATADTQWVLFQQGTSTGGAEIVFQIKDAAAALKTVSFLLAATELDQWMWIAATFTGGTLSLYKNGVLVDVETYTTSVASGSGDFYIGRHVDDTAHGPGAAQGDLAHVALWTSTALTALQIAQLFVSGTWARGGLDVGFAMTEPKQAQDWLRQLLALRGMRLGMNASRQFTLTVDTNQGATLLDLGGDDPGDGERNLLDLRDRQRPGIDETVSDVVVRYRRDMTSGAFQFERRRTVSSHGREWVVELDVIRDHTAADRVAQYLAERLATDETVEVEIVEPREIGLGDWYLEVGDLVTLTDAASGYAGDTLEVLGIRRALLSTRLTLGEYSTERYTYVPAALTIGSEPG